MENKLLSCPFCGKIDTLIVGSDLELSCKEDYDDWSELNSETFAVVCDFLKGGCGATSGFRDSKEFAIHTWNTRALSERHQRLVEAAKGMLNAVTVLCGDDDNSCFSTCSLAKECDKDSGNDCLWVVRLRAALEGEG